MKEKPRKGKEEIIYTREQIDSIAQWLQGISVTGRQSILLASIIQTLEQGEVRIVEVLEEEGDE